MSSSGSPPPSSTFADRSQTSPRPVALLDWSDALLRVLRREVGAIHGEHEGRIERHARDRVASGRDLIWRALVRVRQTHELAEPATTCGSIEMQQEDRAAIRARDDRVHWRAEGRGLRVTR